MRQVPPGEPPAPCSQPAVLVQQIFTWLTALPNPTMPVSHCAREPHSCEKEGLHIRSKLVDNL